MFDLEYVDLVLDLIWALQLDLEGSKDYRAYLLGKGM